MPRAPLTPASSSLLRAALDDGRFDVFAFFDHPAGLERRRGEQAEEAAAWVADYLTSTGQAEAEELVMRHLDYLEAYEPDRLAAAATPQDLKRLAAFTALDIALQDGLSERSAEALGNPEPDQLVFQDRPDLFELITRDGLLPLTPERLATEHPDGGRLFRWGEQALHPHPALAPMRELVSELIQVAEEGKLQVAVAVDPHRRESLVDVQPRLLEDYWHGIKLTPGVLDALDEHAVGVRAFHHAGQRTLAQRYFKPLLGTWFDWQGRGDHPADPVKRLYIEEVKPMTDRTGEPSAAVESRVLHTERDTQRKRFTHVDGKVVIYDADGYEPSEQTPSASLPRPVQARKLWRVDGDIGDEQWARLVGLFFRGNELIEEHFQQVISDGWPPAGA